MLNGKVAKEGDNNVTQSSQSFAVPHPKSHELKLQNAFELPAEEAQESVAPSPWASNAHQPVLELKVAQAHESKFAALPLEIIPEHHRSYNTSKKTG